MTKWCRSLVVALLLSSAGLISAQTFTNVADVLGLSPEQLAKMPPEVVLDAWSGSSVGHVGWCWYRSGGWVRVISTNMKLGTDVLTYGGAVFRAAWFYDLGNNTVYCWENGKTYPLKAFVTKK